MTNLKTKRSMLIMFYDIIAVENFNLREANLPMKMMTVAEILKWLVIFKLKEDIFFKFVQFSLF